MRAANEIEGIEAVIFDVDGTLVDSEPLTPLAIEAVLRARGVAPDVLGGRCFAGLAWESVAGQLLRAEPRLAGDDRPALAQALQRRYQQLLTTRFPAPIPGAADAVRAASRTLPTGIASSSNRQSVEHVVGQLGIGSACRAVICAEDCARGKPDPECYLLAARALGCAPGRCLVFEDSGPGLQAARAAGAVVTAIIRGKRGAARDAALALADVAVEDFAALPAGFFEAIASAAR